MENEPAKSAPRRPALQGLDAKALFAAGLEASSPPNQSSPKPAHGPKLSRRHWLAVGGLTALTAGTGWFYLREKPEPWQELLPQINLNSSHYRGEWRHTGEGVEIVRDDQPGVLAMPVTDPGASYDLRFAFTRLTGQFAITLFFRAVQGTATLEFDSWEQPGLAGIQLIDSQDLRQNGSFHFPVMNGVNYEFLLEIRPDEARIFHQEKLLKKYPLTGSRLEVSAPWGWQDAWTDVSLAVGAWNSKVRFTRLSYRKVF